MDHNDCLSQDEWIERENAQILADALLNGRSLYNVVTSGYAFAVVTKALVDLRRASGAPPEVMLGTLLVAALTCPDTNQRRAYGDEARKIAAKIDNRDVRGLVFASTR